MRPRTHYQLPPDKQAELKQALRIEWITIGALLVIIAVMYLAMGASQAMKTAWLEDILSLVPPIVFIIAYYVERRAPTAKFPYGFRRAGGLAFLGASIALTLLGFYILYDAIIKLIGREHPTIGLMDLWGRQVWSGWVMIAALAFSALPPVILGRLKYPHALNLHDKTLIAGADMNKADWTTAVAAIVGILGVGLGWWWADAVAAALISLDITRDGLVNTRNAFMDLMDRRPQKTEKDEVDPIPYVLRDELCKLPWVSDVAVRMREDGRTLVGEGFLTLKGECVRPEQLAEARRLALDFDWRIADVIVTVVDRLDTEP